MNIGTMEVSRGVLGEDVAATGDADRVALGIVNQAGRHVSRRLGVPSNPRLAFLPPYSQELNPVENLWRCIRSRRTSNHTCADYSHLLEAVGAAWRSLTKTRLRFVCKCDYLTPRLRP
ncbi:MAG: hypothetical protein EDM82_03060 [Cyanobacteria bacterium CYA]|nr:MAG: hypothetical protein EDM82_03060 [Cyanobacteria bacterium CYA]